MPDEYLNCETIKNNVDDQMVMLYLRKELRDILNLKWKQFVEIIVLKRILNKYKIPNVWYRVSFFIIFVKILYYCLT